MAKTSMKIKQNRPQSIPPEIQPLQDLRQAACLPSEIRHLPYLLQ